MMYTFPEEIRETLERIPVSLVYYQNIDGKAVPVLASDGFCRNTGMDRARVLEWLGRGMFERMHPDDVGVVSQVSEAFINQRGSYDLVFRCRLSSAPTAAVTQRNHTGANYVLIHAIGSWQIMPDGTELAVIAYANLSSTQDMLRERIEQYRMFQKDRFYTDPLTELPNINYLHEFGSEKVATILADGRTPMVIYSDVESMQSYNNQYGFEEGDALLKLIAHTLKDQFPKALVTRGSDDHFIILVGMDDKDELKHRMETVNERIKCSAKGNTNGLRCGISNVDADGDGDVLGRAVDHAKHALKWIDTFINQRVRFFSSVSEDAYWRSRYIVENIDRAIENGWIKVYYHGLFRIQTGKLAAFEALARWVDPVRGTISPAEFIPVLQKYHLLYKLDLCMFEQVCREVLIRHENGLELLPVSVNFSRQDFDHTDVVDRMNEIYEKTGAGELVEKSNFIIEITEQEVASNPQSCQLQVRRIKDSGYRLWLDDFGSGYSSFDMFSKFQFDLIKFDMELLHHLDDNNGANRLVLKELVYLARSLKLHTLIEGVETEEQLTFLKEIGCELAQGYYYHKPEPLVEVLFRKRAGGSIKVGETPDERNELNRKWFE